VEPVYGLGAAGVAKEPARWLAAGGAKEPGWWPAAAVEVPRRPVCELVAGADPGGLVW
jgi:hypothetical protein